jgi:hypothetical protein
MKFWPELGLEKNPDIGLVLEFGIEFLGSIAKTMPIIPKVIVNHILSTIVIVGVFVF